MQEAFRLVVPVVPVAQPRQRHAMIAGHVANYTPTKHPVQTFKATVRLCAQQAGARMLDGPLAVTVAFYFPRPARLMRKRDPDGPVRHISKPDVDNVWKTLDCLTSLLWRDDAQICSTTIDKWYHGKAEAPRVELVVYQLGEG